MRCTRSAPTTGSSGQSSSAGTGRTGSSGRRPSRRVSRRAPRRRQPRRSRPSRCCSRARPGNAGSGRCGARGPRRAARTARAGPRPRRAPRRGSWCRAGPSTTAPWRSERTCTKPIPGCSRSAGTSLGWSSSSRSSVTRPGSRGNVISPRQPEAITESSGSSSSVRRLAELLSRLLVESDDAVRAPLPRDALDGPPRRRVVARNLGEPGAQIGDRLVAAAGRGLDLAGVAGGADELLERDAVAL